MNPKLVVIRLLLDKSVWSEYRHYIKPNDDRHLKRLYSLLDEFMELSDTNVSLEAFKSFVELSSESEKDKDKEIYTSYLDVVENADISDQVIHTFLIKIKQREIAERLANVSFEYLEGHKTIDDIAEVYHLFSEVDQSVEDVEFVNDDIEVIYNDILRSPGLRWRLQTLNKMLGSLRKGDFGFVFARPESGKTTFLASEATNFASQSDKPVLWFNNEEQGQKVVLRCYQAAIGATKEQIENNLLEAKRRYYRITKNNLKIFDDASIYRRRVEDICKKYEPALIIFDQLDKIKGFDGDRDDLKLGAIYQWARELAKTYCPVIAVSQANGTGEGVKWLNMGHVSGATTSKQAEADFIIGIGKTNDTTNEYLRHFNISKNKLAGDPDSEPSMRHGKADILIKPEIARYQDYETI